jgi:hypothetical protein
VKTTNIEQPKEVTEYKIVQVPVQVENRIETPDGRVLNINEALTELLNDNLAIQGYLAKLIKG